MHVCIFNEYMLQCEYRLNDTNGYSDTPGVTVTAADFGNTSSVEYLDLTNSIPYFVFFVDYFVQRGYTRDVNIRAAPYDWRLGAGTYN